MSDGAGESAEKDGHNDLIQHCNNDQKPESILTARRVKTYRRCQEASDVDVSKNRNTAGNLPFSSPSPHAPGIANIAKFPRQYYYYYYYYY